MSGISPKLPLVANSEDGHYGLTKTFLEATKQNFKHLLLTIPGEKVFDVNFGVGLNQFLFEQDPYFVKGEISAKIQVARFAISKSRKLRRNKRQLVEPKVDIQASTI